MRVGPLLGWATRELRDLPWRRTREPWAVLVSEVMLQQTQASRVEARFGPFLERFPTPAACASAAVGDVVDAWSGLGFNRRAVSLHGAAALMVERHAGAVPADLDDLLALPGVGAYTARAVLVFAHGRTVGVVDTNVARVLARTQGSRLTPTEAQALADSLVPADRPWEWNQAMIELGALVCTSRSPDCPACPLRGGCRWSSAGRTAPDPAVGSAGTSRPQSRFEGSDRQGRGRLVVALRDGPVAVDAVAEAVGWPGQGERANRMLAGLVADGLATVDDGLVRLP